MHRSNRSQNNRDQVYPWYVCGFLLLAIGLIYGQTLGFPLLDYDDNGFIYQEPHVLAGLTPDSIGWAFTAGPFGDWYPLAALSHMLDVELFGLHAWGHHLTNVLLHAAASIALFLVLRQMTAEIWPSALVALIFAIHPQHVESVAWVSERRDVLSGLFFMLTLGAWLGYLRHGGAWRYWLTALLFAFGLMAKPMIVTLPPLLLLLDFWPLGRLGQASDLSDWTKFIPRPSRTRLVAEKLPLVALAAGDCYLTLRSHRSIGLPQTLVQRVGNAAVSCVRYVVQCFFPIDLAANYPLPPAGQPLWQVAAAVAILAIVSAAVVIGRRRRPYGFVGWFWYLGMLAPVLGVVSVAAHAMADQYMYLPGIGLYIALSWAAVRWAGRLPQRTWIVATSAAVVGVALVALSAWQTSYWKDEESLWRHALSCTAANAEAEVGLADALARQGQRADANVYYLRAQQHPTDSSPFNNYGSVLAQDGKLDEAIAQFRQALQIEPDSFRAHANLGRTLAQRNRLDESLEHLSRAVALNPLDSAAHRDLAHLYRLMGRTDDALAEFQRAVAFDPRDYLARHDLAVLLMEQGNLDQAIPQLEVAVGIEPRFALAHFNLAAALAQTGETAAAAAHYRQVLSLEPNNQAARENLDKLPRGPPPPAAR